MKILPMTHAVPDILARIVGKKQAELSAVRQRRAELELLAEQAVAGRRNFEQAIRTKSPAVIAEIKQASPSKGTLVSDFHPAEIARQYESGGAAALSVLTDEAFFKGSVADLRSARAAVSIPVLRKDFTIDEIHVIEAAANGADAILLIAAILNENEMRRYRELAATFDMASLVEVHDASELEPAISSGASIIGVNNRNLHTFEVTLETSLALAGRIPAYCVKVSESGIETPQQVATLQSAGYSAFLVGEHLMRSGNAAHSLRALCS